jgi:uncharacterized membrane protein
MSPATDPLPVHSGALDVHTTPPPVTGPGGVVARVPSVDMLRGLVMVLMAIDHVRDFVHAEAMNFQPEDLTRTTSAIFFTRWITHFCAPVFMLCAGLGVWFRVERRGTLKGVSLFLATRGLWLIVLELTVVHFGLFFNLDHRLMFLLVFWALGMSMIVMAALVHLRYAALLAVSVGMIALHNLANGVSASSFGNFAWLWRILHEQGIIQTGGPMLFVAYPLVPWIGVMGAGFCLGRVYRFPAERRRRFLIWLGLGLTAAFLVVRAVNAYGDPRPWAEQSSPVFTVLSFLNTTKYPASLLFLLMTLGPMIALLGLMDRVRPGDRHPLLVFGRVPLLYFVLHIPLAHLIAVAPNAMRYGNAPFLWMPPPTLGSSRQLFPPDFGWDLWVAYAVTALVVLILYPVCVWFSRLKESRRGQWWVSYL